MLQAKWAERKFVCVGLDTDYDKIPQSLKDSYGDQGAMIAMFGFNKGIIDSTKDLVCAYKPNFAFYEKHGEAGIEVLRETIGYIHEVAPDVPVILDFKRGDIDNTNLGSVALLQSLGANAVTIAPYMGMVANKPFLDLSDIGIFVLGRTSNKGAGEFQDLLVEGKPLYRIVVDNVLTKWNYNGNCGVVIGATVPEELAMVRQDNPFAIILIPGVGAQGGDLEAVLHSGFSPKGNGILVNSSRAIIYASDDKDFAEAARLETLKLHDAIVSHWTQRFA